MVRNSPESGKKLANAQFKQIFHTVIYWAWRMA